jgi:diaminopimelate epimerase
LEIRTCERGVEGETLSCGTGSVAAASVARRLGLVEDEVQVQTRGGPLLITFEEGKAFMEGPAATVCSGELSEEYLWNLTIGP